MSEDSSGFSEQDRREIESRVKLDPELNRDFSSYFGDRNADLEFNLTEMIMQKVAPAEAGTLPMRPGMSSVKMGVDDMARRMNYGVKARLRQQQTAERYLIDLKEDIGLGETEFSASYYMLGFFCAGIAIGYSGAIDGLVEAARLQGIQPQEMIQRHLGIIEYIRAEFPSLNEIEYMRIRETALQPIDERLKRFGFYWDEKSSHFKQS